MTRLQRSVGIVASASLIGATVLLSSVRGDGPQRRGHRASITEGLDCGTCHSETGWDTLRASVGGGFDHARTGFPLGGRHVQASCSDCHSQDKPISRQCGSCHDDPHARRLGQDCSDCHSAASFQVDRAMQRHRETRLPLTGMHALLDCTECHSRSTERRFSSVPVSCYSCHARDYRRSDIHPRHTGVAGDPSRRPFPTDCAQCHRATGWSPAVVDPAQLRLAVASAALRAPAGHELFFPILRGAHRGADCQDCHSNLAQPKRVRCTGCHAHAPARLRKLHRGKPVAKRGRDCLSCHPGGATR